MERKLLLASLLVLLPIILLFATTVSAGTTINVNSTLDVINSSDNKCTLREAIIAANTDTASGGVAGECPAGSGTDTIIVPAGTYTLTLAGIEDSALTGDLDITQSVTINGAGVSTIIKQQGTFDRIFEIFSPAQVTLTGMQVQSGNDTSGFGGGGIRNHGTLTLSNVLLIANQSDSEGGSLKNESGASATLNGVSFANNTAPAGGAILNIGVMTVTNATFNYNTAGNAGAIDNGGIITVTNAIFISNTASINNAGSLFNHPSATATLDQVTMAQGTAPTRGGAIENNFGVMTVMNSALYSNTTTGIGGGIYSDGDMTLVNVTLSANSAISATVGQGSGGGIHNENTITLTNTTIANNFATNSGSGIYQHSSAIFTKLKNTIVAYSAGSGNCGGSAVTSLGHNLDSVNTCGFSVTGDITSTDPMLGPLASNGGATSTRALLPGSPAINAGTDSGCPATDQRSFARISPCDIGAFEYVVRLFLPIILK